MDINDKFIESIKQSTEDHFKSLGWSDIEMTIAFLQMGLILHLIRKGTEEGILSSYDKKFPEYLRQVANTIELGLEHLDK